jgi:hypothetical protein
MSACLLLWAQKSCWLRQIGMAGQSLSRPI